MSFALQVFLWDMDKYTLIRKLEGHHNDVVSCEFSPDGALLATASYDTRVIVWDPHTATVLLELGYVTLFPPLFPLALCDFFLKLMLFNWSLIFPSGISSLLPHPYLQEEQMIDGFALWLFVMTVGTLPASLMTGKIMQTLSYLLLKTQHWSYVLQLVACI